jgi:hypothetical protein
LTWLGLDLDLDLSEQLEAWAWAWATGASGTPSYAVLRGVGQVGGLVKGRFLWSFNADVC